MTVHLCTTHLIILISLSRKYGATTVIFSISYFLYFFLEPKHILTTSRTFSIQPLSLEKKSQVSQRYSKQEKLPYFNKWDLQTRRGDSNSHPRRSLSKKFCHSFCLHEREDTLSTISSRTVMDGTGVPAIHCIALANYLTSALFKVNQYVPLMNKMNSECSLRPNDALLRL